MSIKNSSVTQLTREYLSAGDSEECGCCDLCIECCEICGLCSGLCDSCYYHGAHEFHYEDSNSTKVKDAVNVKTVGHDDMAWYVEEKRRRKRQPKSLSTYTILVMELSKLIS